MKRFLDIWLAWFFPTRWFQRVVVAVDFEGKEIIKWKVVYKVKDVGSERFGIIRIDEGDKLVRVPVLYDAESRLWKRLPLPTLEITSSD